LPTKRRRRVRRKSGVVASTEQAVSRAFLFRAAATPLRRLSSARRFKRQKNPFLAETKNGLQTRSLSDVKRRN